MPCLDFFFFFIYHPSQSRLRGRLWWTRNRVDFTVLKEGFEDGNSHHYSAIVLNQQFLLCSILWMLSSFSCTGRELLKQQISAPVCSHVLQRKGNAEYDSGATTGTFCVMLTGRCTREWEQCHSAGLLREERKKAVRLSSSWAEKTIPPSSFRRGRCRVISNRRQTKPRCQHMLPSTDITPAALGGISLARSLCCCFCWHQRRRPTGPHGI